MENVISRELEEPSDWVSATRHMVYLAIKERDAIQNALNTDSSSTSYQKQIRDFTSGRGFEEGKCYVLPVGETAELLATLRPRQGLAAKVKQPTSSS